MKQILSALLLFFTVLSFAQEKYDPLAKPNTYRNADNPNYWKNKMPHAAYWQQDVHYRIKADIDETTDIISGDETTRNKPHPEPYLAMMKKLNVLPTNSVIIEDSLHGLQAGLSSGAHVIAKTGSVPKKDLIIAHKIVSHLHEITDKLIGELLQEPL